MATRCKRQQGPEGYIERALETARARLLGLLTPVLDKEFCVRGQCFTVEICHDNMVLDVYETADSDR